MVHYLLCGSAFTLSYRLNRDDAANAKLVRESSLYTCTYLTTVHVAYVRLAEDRRQAFRRCHGLRQAAPAPSFHQARLAGAGAGRTTTHSTCDSTRPVRAVCERAESGESGVSGGRTRGLHSARPARPALLTVAPGALPLRATRYRRALAPDWLSHAANETRDCAAYSSAGARTCTRCLFAVPSRSDAVRRALATLT